MRRGHACACGAMQKGRASTSLASLAHPRGRSHGQDASIFRYVPAWLARRLTRLLRLVFIQAGNCLANLLCGRRRRVSSVPVAGTWGLRLCPAMPYGSRTRTPPKRRSSSEIVRPAPPRHPGRAGPVRHRGDPPPPFWSLDRRSGRNYCYRGDRRRLRKEMIDRGANHRRQSTGKLGPPGVCVCVCACVDADASRLQR